MMENRNIVLRNMIIDAVRSGKCRTAEDIVVNIQKIDVSFSLEEIQSAFEDLSQQNKVSIIDPTSNNGSFLNYLVASYQNLSFLFPLLTTALMLIFIYIAPNTEPWSAIRIAVGGIFVLFIPGYVLIQLLFPKREMDTTERIALSIGLSFALTPLVALILNYSPWGVRLDPIVISISLLTVSLSILSRYKSFTRSRIEQGLGKLG